MTEEYAEVIFVHGFCNGNARKQQRDTTAVTPQHDEKKLFPRWKWYIYQQLVIVTANVIFAFHH